MNSSLIQCRALALTFVASLIILSCGARSLAQGQGPSSFEGVRLGQPRFIGQPLPAPNMPAMQMPAVRPAAQIPTAGRPAAGPGGEMRPISGSGSGGAGSPAPRPANPGIWHGGPGPTGAVVGISTTGGIGFYVNAGNVQIRSGPVYWGAPGGLARTGCGWRPAAWNGSGFNYCGGSPGWWGYNWCNPICTPIGCGGGWGWTGAYGWYGWGGSQPYYDSVWETNVSQVDPNLLPSGMQPAATAQPTPTPAGPVIRTAYQRGTEALHAGQYSAAAEAMSEHLQAHPRDAIAIRNYAIALLGENKFAEAAATFALAYDYDPTLAYRPIDSSLFARGKTDLRSFANKAMAYARRAKTGSSLFAASVLFQAEGNLKTASKVLAEAEQQGIEARLTTELRKAIEH